MIAAVGKSASHAGGTWLYLTPLHTMTQTVRVLVGDIRKALEYIRQLVLQSPKLNRWRALLRLVCTQITPSNLPRNTRDLLVALE
ncbi:hypothetical protein AWB74_07516 [Caballeronia arvi]|uniref:Uncharacterized protein n=1 Tax=Caballeronia arvi TaxID=1777135 RepID=A0A158KZ04_9BURK|nr:hypothetical protein [Caballeronia arvi]SAL85979.1 hypothetical protein AWB74_07516 [Caballeronia arvi]